MDGNGGEGIPSRSRCRVNTSREQKGEAKGKKGRDTGAKTGTVEEKKGGRKMERREGIDK